MFQPIVELQPQSTFGFEAFVRGPRDSIFESPRAMFALSNRVGSEGRLDRACADVALRAWAATGRDEPLFLNMLPETILDGDDCADDLVQRVDAVGRRPGRGHRRVQRASADQDRESLIAAMIACSSGFGVALDDVGTGNHTREVVEQALPPDYLKLDIFLVREMDAI